MKLFEGRLNKISGLGLAIALSSLVPLIFAVPFAVLFRIESITIHVYDGEHIVLVVGMIIAFAGIFRAMNWPKKAMVGTVIWASVLIFTLMVVPFTDWERGLSPPLINTIEGIQTGAFVVGFVLMYLGIQKARSSLVKNETPRTS